MTELERSESVTSMEAGGGRNPLEELGDKGLKAAVDAVPEGPFKQALKQAGWVGLALGVLIGNVPVSAAASAVVKGTASLDLDKVEIYIRVFVLMAPWVLLFAAIGYMVFSTSRPETSGYGYLFGAVGVFLIGLPISQALGGLVPLEVAGGPKSGSPGGLVQYLFDSLVAYIKLYGALPVIAGFLEGFAFGYWAVLLSGTLPQQPVISTSRPVGSQTGSAAAAPSRPDPAPLDAEWEPSSTYRGGDKVRFRGAQYVVKQGNASVRGVAPPNDSVNWERI